MLISLYAILVIWTSIHLILLLLSLNKIKNSGNEVKFIYSWGFIFGAFVWEDLIVFSILNIGISLLVLIVRNLLPGLILLTVFWLVRSAGETAYFMFQQFIQPKHHPHEISLQLKILRKLFGKISNQKCFIILQVFHQTNLVIFAFILIMLLKYWPEIRF